MNRKTIDELEMLNPIELGELLIKEALFNFPDAQYIQDLIAVGCPIDARNTYNHSALHLAAMCGDLEMVKYLISNGAEVNARNNGDCTPLHYAVNWGDIEVVKYLISNGADIHAINNYDDIPWGVSPITIRKAIPELEPK